MRVEVAFIDGVDKRYFKSRVPSVCRGENKSESNNNGCTGGMFRTLGEERRRRKP